MSLASILYPPPTDNGMKEWAFAHYQHHLAINAGLLSARGVKTTLYRIWPLDPNDAEWAYEHQSQHSEMTSALGMGGFDLSDFNYKDKRLLDAWLFQHFVEHQTAAQRLGLPI